MILEFGLTVRRLEGLNSYMASNLAHSLFANPLIRFIPFMNVQKSKNMLTDGWLTHNVHNIVDLTNGYHS